MDKLRKTFITSSHDVTLNGDYNKWLDDLSQRYEHAKTRAAVKVNSEKLLWNWQMGRDLVMRKAEEQWGTGIVEQLSLDLQNKFPKETGFGSSNIWYMKKWYLFYTEKLQWSVGELLSIDTQQISKLQHIGLKTQDFDTSHGMPFYNLDMIISLGYRIKSLIATRFRQWATERLKEYMIKGFALDDERLKKLGGGNYWKELLDRIRDIRSSVKVMYRQVLDIYATAVDYDPRSELSLKFFKIVQTQR